MGRGKLYDYKDEFIVDVDYTFHDYSEIGWWGELVPKEYRLLADGNRYTIELADGRRGPCSLHRRVNRAVMGVPPLYVYNFRGRGLIR